MSVAEQLGSAGSPYSEDEIVIVVRDGTRRVIRHRRYLARLSADGMDPLTSPPAAVAD